MLQIVMNKRILWNCLLLVAWLQCTDAHDPAQSVAEDTIQPPLITAEPPKRLAFAVGESIEMPCVASGKPEPIYFWQMNGKDERITMKPGEGALIFSDPNEKDEGIYQCLANNSAGVAVTIKVDFRSAYMEVFPETVPRRFFPNLGEKLTLICIRPASFPSPEISWVVEVEENNYLRVILSDRISIDPEGNLHFANVLQSDSFSDRTYGCMMFNPVLRRYTIGSYVVISPVGDQIQRFPPTSVYRDPTYQLALVGEAWRVKCIFSGYPTPRVSWVRRGMPMLPRKREENFGQELVIENVQLSDAGKYECSGINEDATVPQRYIYDLAVESAPFWDQKPESIEATENDTAVFHCSATGDPEPVINWFIDGIPISKVEPNPRRVVERNSITYYNAINDDACVIQCNVTNKHGYIFTNAYLNVLSEKPVITEPPMVGVRAVEGQAVTLTCRVLGSPKPDVVWKKSGEELTGGRFRVTEDGHLVIMDLSLADAGTYACTATNKSGLVSATASLIVRRRTSDNLPRFQARVNRLEDSLN